MKGKFKKRIDKVEAEARPSGSDTTDSEKVGLHVVKVANAIRQDSAASSAIWVRPKVEGQTLRWSLCQCQLFQRNCTTLNLARHASAPPTFC